MELNVALTGMFDAQKELRSQSAISNPSVLSEQMMRLSAYTSAVEEKLADYEKDFETETAFQLKVRLIDNHMKVTQAERETDILTAELKGQIKYLTRLTSSSWKIVGVIQSRINHLVREAGTQI